MGGRATGEGRLKVRVASIGKDRSGLFAPGVAEYAQRLLHYARFSLVELPEGRTREAEAKALLAKRASRERLVALDERGKALDSRELAELLARAQRDGTDLLFVLGGDEGLDESVRRAADTVLSLSRLTLPHRLARLVLVEQLYRAFTILRGEPYHK